MVLNRVMKRWLIIVCLVLALGGSAVLLARRGSGSSRTSSSPDASLLLLGLTNLSAGTYAVFCLSNGTRMHIACVPEAFEQAGPSVGMRTTLSNLGGRNARDWIGVPEELKPGQSVTFMVPPPTTNKTWRLVFQCQERGVLVDPVTDAVRHLTDTNAMQTQDRRFSGRRYQVTSHDVAQ